MYHEEDEADAKARASSTLSTLVTQAVYGDLFLGLARLRGERIVPKGFKGLVPLQGGEADCDTEHDPALRMCIEILDPAAGNAGVAPTTALTDLASRPSSSMGNKARSSRSRQTKTSSANAAAPSTKVDSWEGVLDRDARPVFQAGLRSLMEGTGI